MIDNTVKNFDSDKITDGRVGKCEFCHYRHIRETDIGMPHELWCIKYNYFLVAQQDCKDWMLRKF